MKPSKKLALKREVLAELAPEDLAQVVGGGAMTLPVNRCLSLESCVLTQDIECYVTGSACG